MVDRSTQLQFKDEPSIKEIPTDEVGSEAVLDFNKWVTSLLNDPALIRSLNEGPFKKRELAFKNLNYALEKSFQDQSEVLSNYPPSIGRTYQRALMLTYQSAKSALAEASGLTEEALRAKLRVIGTLIGDDTQKVDLKSLRWGSGKKVSLIDGEKSLSNLWGVDKREVQTFDFDTLKKISSSVGNLTSQEKEILFYVTLSAGTQLLSTTSPSAALQILQLLNCYLDVGDGSFDKQFSVLNFEVEFYKKFKLPKVALTTAEKLYDLSLKELQEHPSPKQLLLTLEGGVLLTNTLAATSSEAASTPGYIRSIRQKLEVTTGELIRRNGAPIEEYHHVIPAARGLLVGIQKNEIDSFRASSNTVEGDKTIAHLAKYYQQESKTLRESYFRSHTLSERVGAGLRNAVFEFTQTDPLPTAGAAVTGCAIGAKFGSLIGLPGGVVGCSFGAGLGLSALSLGQMLYRFDRIADGFSTGVTPHGNDLGLTLEIIDLATTLIPPIKTGSRLLNRGVRMAALGKLSLPERVINRMGIELLPGSGKFEVATWSQILNTNPVGLPGDTKFYQFSEELLQRLLSDKQFQRELDAALSGSGRRFVEKVLSATRSGRDVLTREELNGVFSHAAAEYLGDAGQMVISAGVVGALGGLSAMIIEDQQSNDFELGSPRYLRSLKQVTMMLAFSVALHKTQSRIIANSKELSSLKLLNPEAQVEARFLQKAMELGINAPLSRQLFALIREVEVPKDPILKEYNTGNYRIDTLRRGRHHQQVTGQKVYYVEFDVGGLGALNEHFARAGRNHSEANVHFRNISSIVASRLKGISDSIPFRHGGDEFSFVLTLNDGVGRDRLNRELKQIHQDVREYVIKENLDQIPPTKHDRPAGLGIYVGYAELSAETSMLEIFRKLRYDRFLDATSLTSKKALSWRQVLEMADQQVEKSKKNVRGKVVPPVEPVERRGEIPTLPVQVGEVSRARTRSRFSSPDENLFVGFMDEARKLDPSLHLSQLEPLAPKYERHAPTGLIASTTGQLYQTMKRAGEFSAETGQPAFYWQGEFRGLQSLNSLLGASRANLILGKVSKIFQRELKRVNGDVVFFHRGGGDLGAVILNVDPTKFIEISRAISRQVDRLSKTDPMIKEALHGGIIPEIPASKPGDPPGLHFDSAWAPLHKTIPIGDTFKVVEHENWLKKDRRRNEINPESSYLN